MKSLKLLLPALALALSAAPALASTYTAKDIIDAGESYTFHNALIAKGSKAFSDSFVFSLGDDVTGAAFLFNVGLPDSPINEFAVTYDGDVVSVSGGNVFGTYTTTKKEKTFTYAELDKAEYTCALNDLDSGLTSVNIAGTFDKAFKSPMSYSLTVTATSTVPEPDSLALIFAGIGLMAAVARRQSKSR